MESRFLRAILLACFIPESSLQLVNVEVVCPSGYHFAATGSGGPVCRADPALPQPPSSSSANNADTRSNHVQRFGRAWVCPKDFVRNPEPNPDQWCLEPTVGKIPTVCAPSVHWPISDANQLMFVHVPKTGGNSVESSQLFKDRREALGRSYVGGHHKFRDLPYVSPACKGYHTFAFVRHPCERLRSLWAYYAGGLGNADDKAWVATHLSSQARRNFSTFVLEAEKPPAGSKTWQWQDQVHMQSQLGMLFGKDGHSVGVQQVLETERWDESIHALDKALNCPTTVAQRTAAKSALSSLGVHVNLHVDVRSSLQRTHHLASNHSRGHCPLDLTPAAWNALVRMYRLDFCGLGYSTLRSIPGKRGSAPSESVWLNGAPTLDALKPANINARLRVCTQSSSREARIRRNSLRGAIGSSISSNSKIQS